MNDLPDKDWKDYGHSTVKGALNLIPLAGGALSVAFETIFTAPLDKRKEEWLKNLATAIDELYVKVDGLTPEKLSSNQEFITAVLEASNIAVRSHHTERLSALKSAVKNTVIRTDLNESKKMIFIRVVGEMTPLHFQVLHFLSHPGAYIDKLNSKQRSIQTHWGDLQNVWNKTFSEIKSDDPIITLAIKDLHNYGFIRIDEFYKASMESVATSLGKEFAEFIGADV
ncbi:hypothetical protein [Pseudomonas sp. UBA2684]|uniref:hypothetical protein n=1 Tax=Pseudomonas sp. UBA2684 TaxID=1947311 RepID=UPI0025E947F3|nr:hypothetical protein [Pseudomonas sp. UBA2684]